MKHIRYKVKMFDFSADLIWFDGEAPGWNCGSCSSPPLGPLAEMSRYRQFIDALLRCMAVLTCKSQGFALTRGETTFLKSLIVGYR